MATACSSGSVFNQKRFLRLLLFATGLLLANGCTTLSFRTAEVRFEDPALRLGIVKSEPTEAEKSGVSLKLSPPSSLRVEIRSKIIETTYLDYQQGSIIAKVTRTQSQTTSPSLPLADSGESQSLFYASQ